MLVGSIFACILSICWQLTSDWLLAADWASIVVVAVADENIGFISNVLLISSDENSVTNVRKTQ